jgi:mannose-1-phosphate guanylyltransferase
VLAAGAGKRLAPLTGGIPKQYWRRGSAPTLLEDTLARVGHWPHDQTIIVAADGHRVHLESDARIRRRARVLFQSLDRGTAAGVLLALTPVLQEDPDAMVVLTPADHGVEDLGVFRKGLDIALAHVNAVDDVVVCGVEASEPVSDYGWILPGHRSGTAPIRPVSAFVEKPATPVARRLMQNGGAWNTMVVVARARVLLALFETHLPAIAGTFERARRLSADRIPAYLAAVYPEMPSRDFSRDLMERARNLATYIWPADMGWSDLGTPDRMLRWAATPRPGRRPPAGARAVTGPAPQMADCL